MKSLKVFKDVLSMIILFVAGFELGENHHATKIDWEFVLFIAAITLAFIIWWFFGYYLPKKKAGRENETYKR